MSSDIDPAGPMATHPVLACVESVESSLKDVRDVPVAFMDPRDKKAALLQLSRVEAQLVALRLRVMAASDDVALDEGARDVAALLTHHTRGDQLAHRRELRLAEALDQRWARTGEALAGGEVNVAQAAVIARALDELPADLPAEVVGDAEAHLVSEAAHFGPRELRWLGRKILEVVAPEIAETQEAEQLAKEEDRARRGTSLTSTRLGDGTTRIVINVPDAVATRLRTYLEAFTSPRHDRNGEAGGTGPLLGEADRIPVDRKRGQAFCALLEAVDPKRLPAHGGDATTLIITVPLDQLRQNLGVAELGPADRLTAAEARRLACTAQIIPAVLGGKSEVLDLGRVSRFFKPAQRKAMIIRDRECRAEGCTIPAAWCEAHHWGTPWAEGGRTDLKDGVLLCPWHHHRAHDPKYDATKMPNGDVRFHRPT
jgi:hypothetical protein